MADPGRPLEVLVFCGLLGAVGQFVRAIGGLNRMLRRCERQQCQLCDLFVASRLVFSLLIGFVAGVLAGIATGLIAAGQIPTDANTMFGIAASGYAGVDFIELGGAEYRRQDRCTGGATKDGRRQHQSREPRIQCAAADLAAPRRTAPLDGIISGWVKIGVKPLGDDAIRSGIAYCLNGYHKPTQPLPAPGTKYWQGQLSAQFKGSDPDWYQAACDLVHDQPSPFAADGLMLNSVYIEHKSNAGNPPSFTLEDFFVCIQQSYLHPIGQ